MTSAINPNNIDGAYPVAGQDNDSQGFRDNFTNTKQNFTYAAQEITDLQSKVVLKAALTGTTLNNDMGGSFLSNAVLQDMAETRVALGTLSGTDIAINYAAGSYYTLTTSGSVGLEFTNFPPAGQTGKIRVQITISNTAHTLTLPVAVGTGASNISTQYIQGWSSNIITFSSIGTYVFEFTTSDGGASIFIEDLTRGQASVQSDIFSANGVISLGTVSTVITNSANLIGTVADGFPCQTKVLAYGNTSVGNTLVTFANAAWGGSGIANLSAVGSAATFQYINSKWYCVGNNGVTFS